MIPLQHVLVIELNPCCTCTVSMNDGCRFIQIICGESPESSSTWGPSVGPIFKSCTGGYNNSFSKILVLISFHLQHEYITYRNLPIKGAPIIRAPPSVCGKPILLKKTKIGVVSLIIVRFSIRNQRWKAWNVSFVLSISNVTLLERPAPLLGRLR